MITKRKNNQASSKSSLASKKTKKKGIVNTKKNSNISPTSKSIFNEEGLLSPLRLRFLKNTALAIILVGLSLGLTQEGGPFKWYYKDLLITNFKYVLGEHGDLDFKQRYQTKMGFTYIYLNFIKERTPENAIILMPNKDIFMQEGAEQKFRPHITAKGFASYFLYPRKVVYEWEKNSNPLYSQATHVAIVNKWGYEKLQYRVEGQVNYTIAPIAIPPRN